jgi:hypothetical protein
MAQLLDCEQSRSSPFSEILKISAWSDGCWNIRMKILLLTILLLFPAISPAQGLEDKIKGFRNSKRFTVNYDKFKDASRVDVGPFDVGDSIRSTRIYSLKMTARFFYTGRDPHGPDQDFALLFRSRSGEWQFLKNHELNMLIDGERVSIGEAEYDGDIERSGVSEFMGYLIPPDVFKRLASARQVEFKIGRWEVALKDEHLQALRDLLSLTK